MNGATMGTEAIHFEDWRHLACQFCVILWWQICSPLRFIVVLWVFWKLLQSCDGLPSTLFSILISCHQTLFLSETEKSTSAPLKSRTTLPGAKWSCTVHCSNRCWPTKETLKLSWPVKNEQPAVMNEESSVLVMLYTGTWLCLFLWKLKVIYINILYFLWTFTYIKMKKKMWIWNCLEWHFLKCQILIYLFI